MTCEWVGSIVSLDCGETLGTYQGRVMRIDNNTQALTISKAYRNGLRCEVPEITINAGDIKDLKILKSPTEAERLLSKQATPSKLSKEVEEAVNPKCPSPLKLVQSTNHVYMNGHHNGRHSANGQRITPTRDYHETNGQYYATGNGSARHTPTRDHGEQSGPRHNSVLDSKGRKSTTPRKMNGRNENHRKGNTREDCFSTPVESYLTKDFDFEKNLALFDKKAVYQEIENLYPEVVQRVADKKPEKYRCDENVLQSGPVQLQQIRVPQSGGRDFVTDAGLVVPSVTYQLRNKILTMAEHCGLTVDRQVEMVGRSASEMVLQLLGGSHRLNPKNDHQLPTVIVLCGPHTQGAQGISCARHLANHNVKTIIFVPNFVRMSTTLENELKLYDFCDGKKTSTTKELPAMPDMIVNALDSHDNPNLKDHTWYKHLVEWARNKRAPCLAVDPPVEGAVIDSKWSLALCLPLNLKNKTSQVYLCDLGLPKKVFVEAGISYVSPFSHKFVIPLHRR